MTDGLSVMERVLEVFTSVATWFAGFVNSISSLFWSDTVGDGSGALTFLGVLAVCGLAFSVIFLVIGLISNFLHFRG